jgi:inorganic triphosphatase YgiF
MRANSRSLTESEITFVVCADHPRQVLEQIGRMTSIGGLRVEGVGSLQIRDCYFDTAGRVLQGSHWALRIRKIRSECFIALKGPEAETPWGGVKRTEFEEPWSQEALRVTVAELAGHHIGLPGGLTGFDATLPEDVLARLGLEKIQDRQTLRQVLEIMAKSVLNGSSLVEVDLDTVIYSFHNRKIRHHEVEIEARAEENQDLLTIVVEELIAAHGSLVRRWDHSKLATGLAIEELLATGCLVIPEKDRELVPGDYEKIDAFLKCG